MATNTERIEQLEKLANFLSTREQVIAVRLEGLEQADARSEAAASALRKELDHIRQKSMEADQRLALLESASKQSRDELEKATAECASLRAAFTQSETRNGSLETTVNQLKASSEKWGQRGWQIVAALMIAALSALVGRLTKP